ncbi:MAG: putative membrane protein (DUF2078) [Haloquadratum walsbyi J07HQW1]|uniref:Putative membrane protein (DUF2078) n=1 Tax=Haloquadratum walsbyi J07HQW1 TaxID=1238424 RepID=U1N543_9EURY|nr:MAG: putative membrane protein (DUF2078) [Haloquadratum walsbyi J07HQW1]
MSDIEEPYSDEDTLNMIAAGVVTTVTLLVGFGLLAAGVSYFWVAFLVGFAGVLPLTIGVLRFYRENNNTSNQTSKEDPITTLRERYANGELTDEEFENQVEKLIETESGVSFHSKCESEREIEREK